MNHLLHATNRWRCLAKAAAAGFLLSLALQPTLAAGFPQKAVTLVVPYAAGGSTDVLARALSEAASKSLGQPILIDNRTGAGGNIGTQMVKRASADGYTLLMCSFGCAVAPAMYSPVPFDIVTDFEPVALLGTVPSVLVVNTAVPAKNLKELIVYGKAHPRKLNAASAGVGSSPHMGIELLRARTGVEVTHIPYKGVSAAAADLLGGQIDMLFDNLTTAIGNIRTGKVRAIAVASEQRIPALPEVPTFAEAGVSQFSVVPWFGIMAPARTPAHIVEKLNEAYAAALKSPEVLARTAALGVQPGSGNRQDLAAFVQRERDKWSSLIKAHNIKAD